MRKSFKYIVFVLCISALALLVYLFISFNKFTIGFLENFYSDLIVGIAIAYFITWYLKQSEKLDFEVFGVVKETGNNSFAIDFILVNKGDISFEGNQVYYNIIFVKKYEGFLVDPKAFERFISRNGTELFRIQGLLIGPSYPDRGTKLATIQLKDIKDIDNLREGWEFFFTLSTPKGIVPKDAVPESGMYFKWKDLGEVKFTNINEIIGELEV